MKINSKLLTTYLSDSLKISLQFKNNNNNNKNKTRNVEKHFNFVIILFSSINIPLCDAYHIFYEKKIHEIFKSTTNY